MSRLSHYSTSHHDETLVKTAYFHHAMAEYVIIQTEIKLKYNLLQLEKSLKKSPHCPINRYKTQTSNQSIATAKNTTK